MISKDVSTWKNDISYYVYTYIYIYTHMIIYIYIYPFETKMCTKDTPKAVSINGVSQNEFMFRMSSEIPLKYMDDRQV